MGAEGGEQEVGGREVLEVSVLKSVTCSVQVLAFRTRIPILYLTTNSTVDFSMLLTYMSCGILDISCLCQPHPIKQPHCTILVQVLVKRQVEVFTGHQAQCDGSSGIDMIPMIRDIT